MSAARGSAVSMRSRQCEQSVHCQFCQLDYCNAILNGAADVQMKRLQSVQNTVDRLFSGARRRGHVSHGSPPEPSSATRQRLFFRLLSLFGSASMASPQHIYESSSVSRWTSPRLRAASTGCIQVYHGCRHQSDRLSLSLETLGLQCRTVCHQPCATTVCY